MWSECVPSIFLDGLSALPNVSVFPRHNFFEAGNFYAIQFSFYDALEIYQKINIAIAAVQERSLLFSNNSYVYLSSIIPMVRKLATLCWMHRPKLLSTVFPIFILVFFPYF